MAIEIHSDEDDLSCTCSFIGKNGETCEHEVFKDGLCYWHHTDKKTDPDLISKLEARARTGIPMVGFSLRSANLEGIDLVNRGKQYGYKLVDADLYRCNLKKAHLFHIDLSGSSLMKANMEQANLNCATLQNVNLLGIDLLNAKLDNISWDNHIIQEQQASKAKTPKERLDYYEQAEEIYRNLRKTTEAQGLFELTGYFFQREMVMRRYQQPRGSLKRILSKIVDVFCGYGEEPSRVVAISLVTIFTFALLFFFVGITDGENSLQFSLNHSISDNLSRFFHSLYFSVVTFTTLGYGDLAPVGIARAFAAIEAFVGSFTLALFVVVFVKKMTR